MGNIKWIAFLHLSIVFPRILNIKCMCWLFVSWMGEAERKYIGLHWDKTEWITLMVFHKRCKWRMPLYCDSWRKADKKLIPRSSLILDPRPNHCGLFLLCLIDNQQRLLQSVFLLCLIDNQQRLLQSVQWLWWSLIRHQGAWMNNHQVPGCRKLIFFFLIFLFWFSTTTKTLTSATHSKSYRERVQKPQLWNPSTTHHGIKNQLTKLKISLPK